MEASSQTRSLCDFGYLFFNEVSAKGQNFVEAFPEAKALLGQAIITRSVMNERTIDHRTRVSSGVDSTFCEPTLCAVDGLLEPITYHVLLPEDECVRVDLGKDRLHVPTPKSMPERRRNPVPLLERRNGRTRVTKRHDQAVDRRKPFPRVERQAKARVFHRVRFELRPQIANRI